MGVDSGGVSSGDGVGVQGGGARGAASASSPPTNLCSRPSLHGSGRRCRFWALADEPEDGDVSDASSDGEEIGWFTQLSPIENRYEYMVVHNILFSSTNRQLEEDRLPDVCREKCIHEEYLAIREGGGAEHHELGLKRPGILERAAAWSTTSWG